MKKPSTYILLCFIFLLCNSFKPEGYRDLYKNDGSILVTVNGQAFQLRDKDFYRAMLVTKTNPFALSVHDRTRTATSILLYGLDSTDATSGTFSENVSIEYTFSASTQGDAPDVGFEMSYNFGNYYMMPERNFFKVSKMEWSADKSYFTLSGSFNCMMHRRGYSNDVQPSVRLKGEVSDIKVSVPPWIASKINTETSQAEGQ